MISPLSDLSYVALTNRRNNREENTERRDQFRSYRSGGISIVWSTTTQRLTKAQQTEASPCIHYNNNKYLYRSLIRGCPIKHRQSHTIFIRYLASYLEMRPESQVGLHIKFWFLSDFKTQFDQLTRFTKTPHFKNLMKIHLSDCYCMRMDTQTGRSSVITSWSCSDQNMGFLLMNMSFLFELFYFLQMTGRCPQIRNNYNGLVQLCGNVTGNL
jgi:hypothetical protein